MPGDVPAVRFRPSAGTSAALPPPPPLAPALLSSAPLAPSNSGAVLSPTSNHPTSVSGVDDGSETTVGSPSRKRQKRNKPTLSCEQCVERKTKCDRGRPLCLACMKRQSDCRYSDAANLIAAIGPTKSRKEDRSRRDSASTINSGCPTLPPEVGTRPPYRSPSTSSASSSPLLLSTFAHTRQSSSHIFGVGSGHPFANYWTCQGGLQEVIRVLPSKDQADILIAKYFEAVDPVYPLVNKGHFYADYDRFWSLSHAEKHKIDAASVALHFAMFAMGTQFIQTNSDAERVQIAEFYVSAAHQSLRLSSYLSRSCLSSIQAMVLICYFLMNDNHATDAFAFGGILLRQAYAMGLNREPDVIVPNASPAEKQQRRKIWQAVLLQDTLLTVLLKLPPTATHTDVAVESLTEDPVPPESGRTPSVSATSSMTAIENCMSIAIIAPNPDAGAPSPTPHHCCPSPYDAHTPANSSEDIAYIRSMWRLTNLVQRTFCTPRSLSRPLAASPAEKASLLAQYRSLYASFPLPLTTDSPAALAEYAASKPRLVRQNLFLRSNYWHCVTTILIEEHEPTITTVTTEAAKVRRDVRGGLEAALTAIHSFFSLWELLRVDAGVWWVFQHRAFEEALILASLLSKQRRTSSAHAHPLSPTSTVNGADAGVSSTDPLAVQAKEAVRYMLDILEHIGVHAPEMQKTRTEVLSRALEEIGW